MRHQFESIVLAQDRSNRHSSGSRPIGLWLWLKKRRRRGLGLGCFKFGSKSARRRRKKEVLGAWFGVLKIALKGFAAHQNLDFGLRTLGGFKPHPKPETLPKPHPKTLPQQQPQPKLRPQRRSPSRASSPARRGGCLRREGWVCGDFQGLGVFLGVFPVLFLPLKRNWESELGKTEQKPSFRAPVWFLFLAFCLCLVFAL